MKLHFVYNADAGIAAGLRDSLHKLVSPATYPCDLCAITYGALRMDPKWKAWLNGAPFEAVFHHRHDFRAAWPAIGEPLPAIFRERNGALETLVAATDLAKLDSVDALIALIESRLDEAKIALFAYGTLQQTEVQQASFGRLLDGVADSLPGHRLVPLVILDPRVVALSGKPVHTAARPSADQDDVVPGMIFRLTEAELDAADAYEVADMKRVEVKLASGTRAFVYVLAQEGNAAGAPGIAPA